MSDAPIRRSGEDYGYALLSLLPVGQAWPRDPRMPMARFCAGLGEIWGRVDAAAWNLVDVEAQPLSTFLLLPEWERMAGLPNPCVTEPSTIGERRAALVERLTAEGGQSRAYFINVAARLGYDITITEQAPFMCGLSQCGGGDQIGSEEIAFYWWVRVFSQRVIWFEMGLGQCGRDPFARISRAEDLECVLNQYKPAHTRIIFSYYLPPPGLSLDDWPVITVSTRPNAGIDVEIIP